jgi:hypothetical protein
VIGAVLWNRDASALRGGASASAAFVDGYHIGLWVTIALLAVGVVLSYVTLRPGGQQITEPTALVESGATDDAVSADSSAAL